MRNRSSVRINRYAEQSHAKRACILIILAVSGAFVGWTAETLLFLYKRGDFVDRGLLTLPLCPVYGLGMLLLYAVMRTPQSGFWRTWRNKVKTKTARVTVTVLCVLLYALVAALLATATEYITGVIFYKGFGIRLWSYHAHSNNFGGYVCLSYSVMWGALAAAYMGLVWYPLMQLLSRADTAILAPIAFVLVALAAADFGFNILYLQFRGARYMPFG